VNRESASRLLNNCGGRLEAALTPAGNRCHIPGVDFFNRLLAPCVEEAVFTSHACLAEGLRGRGPPRAIPQRLAAPQQRAGLQPGVASFVPHMASTAIDVMPAKQGRSSPGIVAA